MRWLVPLAAPTILPCVAPPRIAAVRPVFATPLAEFAGPGGSRGAHATVPAPFSCEPGRKHRCVA